MAKYEKRLKVMQEVRGDAIGKAKSKLWAFKSNHLNAPGKTFNMNSKSIFSCTPEMR